MRSAIWRSQGEPGHGSMPYGTDNALIKAAKIVNRLTEYQVAPRIDDLFAGPDPGPRP